MRYLRASGIRSWDWSLAALTAGFLLMAPIGNVFGGDFASALAWVSQMLMGNAFADYDDAIAAAAIKRPEYRQPLRTIDSSSQTAMVVNFGRPLTSSSARDSEIWVALDSEVRELCAGVDDPVLALEQALGLPPGGLGNRVVNSLSVPREGLFRPCASADGLEATSCGFDLPPTPKADVDPAALREAYDQLRFFTQQMWSSYRLGFPRSTGSPSDYPSSGYPFTGMGWTYDWGNSSPAHVGVTEFVVKRDAAITVVETKSPAEFCATQ
jgi:hypothetical protein